ncbi:hypothetical protein HPB51_028874 [Rhipicephalus microplus]|uniref:Uncharacterized protein n=1 Tax=Rhipicephalus microplus TaxID=6941 RepID=A0A9J6CWA4_RHIMP|nr:hypothetical protein HPB51_028874 [Rhipicephalus microplus]
MARLLTMVRYILLPPYLPEFSPRCPAIWLIEKETRFHLRNIISQQDAITVAMLPPALRFVWFRSSGPSQTRSPNKPSCLVPPGFGDKESVSSQVFKQSSKNIAFNPAFKTMPCTSRVANGHRVTPTALSTTSAIADGGVHLQTELGQTVPTSACGVPTPAAVQELAEATWIPLRQIHEQLSHEALPCHSIVLDSRSVRAPAICCARTRSHRHRADAAQNACVVHSRTVIAFFS